MHPPQGIVDLIERFARNIDAYKTGRYNETQLRREFIDPFFTALGWDVDNRAGHAEAYKDVIHEDAIRIGAATKAPDYCFRIGGTRKFFIEAKKPSIDIKGDPHPAFQLRRYAWSAKLPLSILTDFEEFAVYDCRIRPKKTDRASTARVKYINYTEYVERWDEIEPVFSHDAILKGSFDKYAQSARNKKGTAEVDAVFLTEIESWREIFAKNIALRNPNLTNRQLNFAVQKTIDRIIFLRIAEDRGIEHYGELLALCNGRDVYQRLLSLFQKADDRYNSGLFHFQREKDRPEGPDELTPGLTIDDAILKDIFKTLYYPDSPYEFSVLPAEILGHVYEQFLGKVITLTPAHRAKIEEKPEVKKAGGVYYTPAYIVDYIVENTVGKLLGSRTIKHFKTRPPRMNPPLTICDPACGSGSFLLGAYQYLLDWHLKYYTDNNPDQWLKSANPAITEATAALAGSHTNYKLTVSERKRILLNHIYGVDIDPQAVEVTKLSLLLKVLEGEKSEMLFATQRALPDLANNIKCGNSLIAPDFYHNQQLAFFDEEQRYKINAFDWKQEFPQIFNTQKKGFDAVIGNPPYVDIKSLPDRDVRYIFSKYTTANNRINLFAAFIEQSFTLFNQAGFAFSMIVPTALLAQSSYMKLRASILDRYSISALARLPNESFGSSAGDVKVDTVILVITHRSTAVPPPVSIVGYSGYDRISKIDPSTAHISGTVLQDRWSRTSETVWSLNTTDSDESVLHKTEASAIPLSDCVDFCLGLTPYDKYKGHTPQQIKQKAFHADSKRDDSFRPLLAGNDVMRYHIEWNGKTWISYGPWLGAPREPRFFIETRILVKQIIDWTTKRIWASMTDAELYNTQNAFNLLSKAAYSLEYILGLLNSQLMTFYHRKRYLDEFKMRFQKILIKDCRRFPIRALDLTDPTDKFRHDNMVSLVQTMLDLNKALQYAKTPDEKTAIKRQITATDNQIDQLVYELYNLTEEEIEIVEAANR